MMPKQDRVVIVTGASSGIGEQTAEAAAARGYRVVVAARRVERLNDLVTRIEAAGGTALAVPCDVTQEDDQQRLIDATLREYSRIDILINNAGVPLPGGFADSSLDDLRRQWQTNVMSLVELTKRALPSLIETHGMVINIGSIAGHFSMPGWGLYYPTKVAVASISDALRRELGPLGVRVCLVEPGPFQTEFPQRAGMSPNVSFGLDPQQVVAAILRLFERPRRLVIVPWWTYPFVVLTSGLVRALPGVVDVFFRLVARRRKADAASSSMR